MVEDYCEKETPAEVVCCELYWNDTLCQSFEPMEKNGCSLRDYANCKRLRCWVNDTVNKCMCHHYSLMTCCLFQNPVILFYICGNMTVGVKMQIQMVPGL